MNAFFGLIQLEHSQSNIDKHQYFTKKVLSNFPRRFPDKKLLTLQNLTVGGGFEVSEVQHQQDTVLLHGEIYNAGEVANTMGRQPADFANNASLIHQLIIQKGTEAIKNINGQFFIIHLDLSGGHIHLFNDQMAIRQVFYYQGKNVLVFGSEIKFVLQHPDCPKDIDWETSLRRPHPNNIYPFKSYKTWFKDILLMPEATQITVDIKNQQIKNTPYWHHTNMYGKYDYSQDTRTTEAIIEEYYHLLDDAVKIRTQGEAVSHSLLSGGLDSSAVVAMAARYKPMDTYSIVSQTTYLETTTDICHNLAKDLHFNNAQFLIPTHEICFNRDLWKRWIWRIESPENHIDSLTKTLLHYAIKRSNPNVKGILTGTGSDQLNGGLARYIIRNSGVAEESWDSFYKLILDTENQKFISHTDYGIWYNRELINRDYLASLKQQKVYDNYWMFYMDSALHSELFSLCWDEIRASNYHGHETRFPFLDYRFIDFIAGIPPHFHQELFFDKQILRIPLRNKNTLPEYVLEKPKAPYNLPEYDFRTRLYDYILDDINLIEEAIGNIDQHHPVINKKNLMDKIKSCKDSSNLFELDGIIQIINIGLLEKMIDKTDDDMDLESLIEAPLEVKFNENTKAFLEKKLSILPPPPPVNLEKPLIFNENCSLLYDKIQDKYFLAKNNELAYEIEEEYADWKKFLLHIDNKKSIQQLLDALSISHSTIEEYLKIALDEKILCTAE